MSKHFTFVMEQTLGHIPFAQNLRWAFDTDNEVLVNWLPVKFEPQSRMERLPLIRNNWSLRGSLQARRLVYTEHKQQGWSDLYLFHTQVISLLSSGWLPAHLPVIISLDATPINYDQVGLAYGHRQGNSQLEKLKFQLNRRAFKKATHLVTWSEWARQSVINDYGVAPERVEVIPPGTNLDFWTSIPRQNHAENKLKLLFVGGDFERKGGRLLYETFRRQLSDKYELHLITQGQIESGDGVFVYRGIKPNSPEIQALFGQADVFVLPTQGDCLPVAITEAMAAGLPVVSTEVGAIREAIVEGENGFVIKPGDGIELARVLTRLAAEPDLRRKMGCKGREFAQAHFDASINGQRLLTICKSLVDRPVKGAPSQPEENSLVHR